MSARHKPDVDALFAALADPARRRAVEILGQGPRRAGELANLLELPAPAMSRHLKELKAVGLIVDSHPEFDARVRVYALQSAPMAELRAWVDATERGWAEQLTAFREHLERAP
jgi:DNA-binding transcriptional ArsR family regulator